MRLIIHLATMIGMLHWLSDISTHDLTHEKCGAGKFGEFADCTANPASEVPVTNFNETHCLGLNQ